MPSFRASTTKTASITLHNPNPADLPVGVSIQVGSSTTSVKSRTISAHSSESIAFSVTMPASVGVHAVSVPVSYNGSSTTYAAGNVQVYELQSPTISFDWGFANAGDLEDEG